MLLVRVENFWLIFFRHKDLHRPFEGVCSNICPNLRSLGVFPIGEMEYTRPSHRKCLPKWPCPIFTMSDLDHCIEKTGSIRLNWNAFQIFGTHLSSVGRKTTNWSVSCNFRNGSTHKPQVQPSLVDHTYMDRNK